MIEFSETWNEEEVYDQQIAPLMTQIIAICKEHGIPMLASFAYAAGNDGHTSFCTTSIPIDGREVQTLNDACRILTRGMDKPSLLAVTITRGRPD